MDGVIQVAVVLVALGTAAQGELPPTGAARTAPAVAARVMVRPVTHGMPVSDQHADDRWLGEDKFRHAGASWAAMVFTYAAARAVHDDPGSAFAVAVPVTAGLGVAKEIADHRRGGPFSARDLVADALGASVAWLVLREVR